jgi:hypothetical protein
MPKKTLLNESQVRQFMKLAKLEPLASGFVEGLTERTEEEMDESHGRGRKEGDAGYNAPDNNTRPKGLTEEEDPDALEDYAAGDLERGHPGEAAEDELEADVELDELPAPDEGADKMISVADLLSALESAIEEVTGEEVETEMDADLEADEADVELDAAADMEVDTDMEMDDEMLAEDEAYTSKKEKPGADKRKGAEKRGAEGTKLKQDEPGGRGHKKGDDAYVNEEQGADDREDEHLGAEDGKESGKKQSMKDRRKEMRGARRAAGEAGDPVPHQESVAANAELVEQITKRVAARILKSALRKR